MLQAEILKNPLTQTKEAPLKQKPPNSSHFWSGKDLYGSSISLEEKLLKKFLRIFQNFSIFREKCQDFNKYFGFLGKKEESSHIPEQEC